MVHKTKKIKTVAWRDNLKEVKIIPITKVPVNNETLETFLKIHKHTDDILRIYHNRGQNLLFKELSDYIMRQTHQNLKFIK